MVRFVGKTERKSKKKHIKLFEFSCRSFPPDWEEGKKLAGFISLFAYLNFKKLIEICHGRSMTRTTETKSSKSICLHKVFESRFPLFRSTSSAPRIFSRHPRKFIVSDSQYGFPNINSKKSCNLITGCVTKCAYVQEMLSPISVHLHFEKKPLLLSKIRFVYRNKFKTLFDIPPPTRLSCYQRK